MDAPIRPSDSMFCLLIAYCLLLIAYCALTYLFFTLNFHTVRRFGILGNGSNSCSLHNHRCLSAKFQPQDSIRTAALIRPPSYLSTG